jgi:hypothetical protein
MAEAFLFSDQAAHIAFCQCAVAALRDSLSDSLSAVADLVLDGDADTTAYQLERQLTRTADEPYSVRTCERSLLHFAAYARSPATAAVLLHHGADVNERDLITGQTPLHAALFAGCAELVALLLLHGADASIRDGYGASVHDWARLLSLLPPAARSPDRRFAVRARDAAAVELCTVAQLERQFGIDYVDCTLADLSYVLELTLSCFTVAAPDTAFRARYGAAMWQAPSEPRDLVIAFVSDAVGYGLFAGRAFRDGDYVCRYGGVARADDAVGDRSYAVASGVDGCVIDGIRARSLGCFINHCSRPNVALQSIFERGVEELLVIACGDISRGDQLLSDYSQQYFDESDPASQPPVDLFGSRIDGL